MYSHVCAVCRGAFTTTTRREARTCSGRCRQRLYITRRAEALAREILSARTP